MDNFYRKNDIGVNIEYTVIGYYMKDSKYMVYTDFTTDNSNKLGVKLYVDKEVDGKFINLDKDDSEKIILEFNKEIMNFKKK